MQKCNEAKERIYFPCSLSPGDVGKYFDLLSESEEINKEVISVDCSTLDVVSSSHIEVLWRTRERCVENNRELRLLNAPAALNHVLRALDMDGLFNIDTQKDTLVQTSASNVPASGLEAIYEDNFAASPDEIKSALSKFENFLGDINTPETVKFELSTVFYEVTYNIHDHAKLSERDKIEFKADASKNRIVMEFMDCGQRFDPTSHIQKHSLEDAVSNRKTRGFGLIMISKLMNSISYSYIDNRKNVLKLEKDWRIENE